MATGRSTIRHSRIYIGGIDFSGYIRNFGPLSRVIEEADLTTLGDACKGYLPGGCTLTMGTVNGVFDNDASPGMYNKLGTVNTGISKVVTIPFGIRAAPAQGDPAWCGQFRRNSYQAATDGAAITASMEFGEWDAGALINYSQPWGQLLHAYGTESAANTAAGITSPPGAETTQGGYFVYQIYSITGTGTVTLSVDEASVANTNVNFAPLTGATSGAIATASAPTSGIIPLAIDAHIQQYLRWQIAFGSSAVSCYFVSAFVRI